MTLTDDELARGGWEVAAVSRRLLARALDVLIGAVLTIVIYGLFLYGLFNGGPALTGSLVLLFAYGVVSIAVPLSKAATIGQLLIGLQNVDVVTARPAGGRTLVKYLVMGLAAQLTFGLILVLALFTMRGPLNRSWFDRLAGVVVARRTHALVGDRDGTAGLPAPASDEASARAVPPSPEPVIAAPVSSAAVSTTPPAWAQLLTDDGSGQPAQGRAGSSASQDRVVEPDRTLLSPVPATAEVGVPVIVLDHGAALPLDRVYVLGRDPSPPPAHSHAKLVPVTDPGRSLSKTHLVIGHDAQGVWLTDLHSTNGVSVTDPDGSLREATPGARTPVPEGSSITYGKRTMKVTR